MPATDPRFRRPHRLPPKGFARRSSLLAAPSDEQEIEVLRRDWRTGRGAGRQAASPATGAVGPRQPNRRRDVAATETLLAREGLYDLDRTEGPTGIYSSALDAAIRAYQRRTGARETGVLAPGDPAVRRGGRDTSADGSVSSRKPAAGKQPTSAEAPVATAPTADDPGPESYDCHALRDEIARVQALIEMTQAGLHHTSAVSRELAERLGEKSRDQGLDLLADLSGAMVRGANPLPSVGWAIFNYGNSVLENQHILGRGRARQGAMEAEVAQLDAWNSRRSALEAEYRARCGGTSRLSVPSPTAEPVARRPGRGAAPGPLALRRTSLLLHGARAPG